MRRTLKDAREALGKSQEKVADDLGVERTTYGRWERGETTPHAHQRPSLAAYLKVSMDELHAMLSSLPLADEQIPLWLSNYLAAEQSATTIWAHEPHVVYGLLQTPEYAAEIARNVGTGQEVAQEYVDRTVDLRKVRQERVHRGELTLHVLQPEFVLNLQVGPPPTMAAQLRHIVEVSELDNVTYQIVPYSAGRHDALIVGIFALISHPWSVTSRVHLESYGGARFIDNLDEVRYFEEAFHQARRLALTPKASAKHIMKRAQQWEKTA